MKVSILGWYEHGNLGDEAMLEGIQYLTEKQFGSCDFTVMNDATFTLEKANESDLFILGGGELINRNRLFINYPAWDYGIKPRKIILGCGLNNPDYASLQDHVKRSLRRFEIVSVRDATTYSFLKEDPKLREKVCLSPDPSSVLASKHNITSKPIEGVAAVIPTDRTEAKRKADEGILVTGIVERTKAHLKQQLTQDGVRLVLLLAFGGDDNDDYASCRQLADYLKDTFTVRVVKPKTPKEALELLSACSKVHSYRLHGIVLAYSLGIPFASYGYHRKIKRVHDTLMAEKEKTGIFQDTTRISEWMPFENRPLGWFTDEEGKLYADTVTEHPKGIIVELGVYMGRSLSFILDQDVTIYAVDIWDTNACPPDPRTYPPVDLGLFMTNLHRMKVPPGKVHVIQLDSVPVARLFDDESVDVILVDSLHTEEHTRQEIEAWWPKLKTGGHILFHDFDIGRRNDPNRGSHVLEAVEAKFGKVDQLAGSLALVKKQ